MYVWWTPEYETCVLYIVTLILIFGINKPVFYIVTLFFYCDMFDFIVEILIFVIRVLHLGACPNQKRRAISYNDSYWGFEVTAGQYTEGETTIRG